MEKPEGLYDFEKEQARERQKRAEEWILKIDREYTQAQAQKNAAKEDVVHYQIPQKKLFFSTEKILWLIPISLLIFLLISLDTPTLKGLCRLILWLSLFIFLFVVLFVIFISFISLVWWKVECFFTKQKISFGEYWWKKTEEKARTSPSYTQEEMDKINTWSLMLMAFLRRLGL